MRADRNWQESAEWQRPPQEPGSTNGAVPQADEESKPAEGAEPDLLKVLLAQFGEFEEYVSYYVMAKTDSVKLSIRNFGLWMVLAALGFVVVAAFVVTASWLLLIGIAEALGVLCGDRLWVGNLMTGAIVLAGLGLGTYYTMAKRAHSSRERTVEKYEKRQARQQTRFGHDVSDQAAATITTRK